MLLRRHPGDETLVEVGNWDEARVKAPGDFK